jgi:hypothetical protein
MASEYDTKIAMDSEARGVRAFSGRQNEYDQRQSLRDRGPIGAQYGELTESLGILGKHIDDIADRLNPVMSPPQPEPATDRNEATKPSLSPLAASLMGETQTVKRLISRVQDLISRLEC